MSKHFLGVWLIYWIAIFLLPVHSIYPATAEAFGLQCAFVVLVFRVLHPYILNFRKKNVADGRWL